MHGNVDIVPEGFTQIRIALCRLAEFRAVQGRGERTGSSSTPAATATPAAATGAATTRGTESELEGDESFRRRLHLIRPSLALRFVEHVSGTSVRVHRNVLPDRPAE